MYEIMTPAEAKALGGLTLAFFGDSVYEVYVREQIVKLGTMPVDKLHKKAVQYVNAGFQSYAYDIIAELLNRRRNRDIQAWQKCHRKQRSTLIQS